MFIQLVITTVTREVNLFLIEDGHSSLQNVTLAARGAIILKICFTKQPPCSQSPFKCEIPHVIEHYKICSIPPQIIQNRTVHFELE